MKSAIWRGEFRLIHPKWRKRRRHWSTYFTLGLGEIIMIFDIINWTQVSAIAACIGVIVSIAFHIKNLASTRLSNSAKMVLDLAGNFNSEEMRSHRRNLANTLISNRNKPDQKELDICRDNPALEFLEEVAYMTKRGVLDLGMVWNSFNWYIEFYYRAVTNPKNIIEEARCRIKSRTLYREIEWLYGQLCKYSIKEKDAAQYIPPSEEEIRRFLEDESTLSVYSHHAEPIPTLPTPRREDVGNFSPEARVAPVSAA
jgi:hypothetical protein